MHFAESPSTVFSGGMSRMKWLPVLISLWLGLLAGPAGACFGPKLYLGVPEGAREQVLAELVVLYVKEKTGIETIQVTVAAGAGSTEVRAERLDLTLAATGDPKLATLLKMPGGLVLLSGRRPLDDLRFTTVAPALKKLENLLTEDFMNRLLADLAAGTPPAAAARQRMMEQRWI
jgi:hypothetical protein